MTECKDCKYLRYDILNPAKMGVCMRNIVNDMPDVVRIHKTACAGFEWGNNPCL